ncbi:VacJ family lipoprotein [Desulfovibrio sp. OttesenSCG-928-G11]|nr:VacJ family lipoprotein [Desulfovibrio sp. OttesenSCG-928-G11]
MKRGTQKTKRARAEMKYRAFLLLAALSLAALTPDALFAPAPGLAAARATSLSHLREAGQPPISADQEATMRSLDDDEAYLDQVGRIIPDPLEGWNRAMFTFNDKVIEYAARPLYKGYEYVTPEIFRDCLSNFFHNAAFPVRFVNNLLQGRPKAAGVEMSRFILNSTAGIGGFFDPAKYHKPVVPVEDEDMGQTFGVWGMGEGCYIVWPLLGPSTARDSFGMVGDFFLDPTTYVDNSAWEIVLGVKAVRVFNDLDDVLDLYDTLKQGAVEPYSSVRDAYVQYRRAKLDK